MFGQEVTQCNLGRLEKVCLEIDVLTSVLSTLIAILSFIHIM